MSELCRPSRRRNTYWAPKAARHLVSYYWYNGLMPSSDLQGRGVQALQIFNLCTPQGNYYRMRESVLYIYIGRCR